MCVLCVAEETPPPATTNQQQQQVEPPAVKNLHHVTFSLHFTLQSLTAHTCCSPPTPQPHHGHPAHRPGEEEADQHQGHRGSGECGGAEEGLQQTPALHPGEGQEHRHSPGLLLRPGPHRQGPPGGSLDPDPAVLLRGRPQGKTADMKSTNASE